MRSSLACLSDVAAGGNDQGNFGRLAKLSIGWLQNYITLYNCYLDRKCLKRKLRVTKAYHMDGGQIKEEEREKLFICLKFDSFEIQKFSIKTSMILTAASCLYGDYRKLQ